MVAREQIQEYMNNFEQLSEKDYQKHQIDGDGASYKRYVRNSDLADICRTALINDEQLTAQRAKRFDNMMDFVTKIEDRMYSKEEVIQIIVNLPKN